MIRRTDRDASLPLHSTAPHASSTAVLEPPAKQEVRNEVVAVPRKQRPKLSKTGGAAVAATSIRHFAALPLEDQASNRQAELFYLQKQIQQQTQMIFVLEDGSRVQGVIEWYDRNSIKVRGKSRVLIYKSAIKYLHKAGEVGSGLEE